MNKWIYPIVKNEKKILKKKTALLTRISHITYLTQKPILIAYENYINCTLSFTH